MTQTTSRHPLAISTLLALQAMAASAAVPTGRQAGVKDFSYQPYSTGSYTVQDIWVDPVNGNDGNSGANRANAVQTVDEAWSRIPMATTLSGTGYQLQLVAGTYGASNLPNYWEQRWGTAAFPVILRSADGPRTAVLSNVNVFDCDYLYFIDLQFQDPNGDVVHCEQCDHFLVRNTLVRGHRQNVQEAVKINQSTHVYIEDCDISGAWDNAIDWVAVQYGHVLGSRIHDSGSWAMYAKGGSAYVRVEGNEIYDAYEGGFTAGQGTGFEFMTDPYLHYEAYDVKFINNVVHDIYGAAFGSNGGYNVLLAYNTAYRVGERSHVIEVAFGERSCDGNAGQCAQNQARGGWGPSSVGPVEPVPDRRVYIYDNIVYNPAPFQSQWQHLFIAGPRTPGGGTNVPNPAYSDDDLRIRGNIIWNGPASHPVGVEGSGEGCQPSNPTCNLAQLIADNHINTIEPELVDPANGNFRPVPGGNVFTATTYAIPSYPGGDWPVPPSPPPAYQGDLTNDVAVDRDGATRTGSSPPGAYAGPPALPTTNILAGAGPAPTAPPTVTVYRPTNAATPVTFAAYGSTGVGVNVSVAEADGSTYGEILTGPGPGAVYGPQVRLFQDDGTPVPKVNYFAYGTLKFGVNVANAGLDGDAFDEILTGAGPGGVFGPHVRGWNFDNAGVAAISKVSFFAYGTLKFGVNVASGRIDGDAFGEILTGPGPGAVFGAQLRGFNYDAAAVTSIGAINAMVFTTRYGCYPAAGDADPDAFAEIGAGSGPDPAGSSSYTLLNYDGAALSVLATRTPYTGAGGVHSFLGDLDGDGFAEVCTSTRGPGVPVQVLGFDWDGVAWSAMPAPSFSPYPAWGVTIGGPLLAGY